MTGWVRCPSCGGIGLGGEVPEVDGRGPVPYVRHPFPFPGGAVFSWCWPGREGEPVRVCSVCGNPLGAKRGSRAGADATCQKSACRSARVTRLRREDEAFAAAVRAREQLARARRKATPIGLAEARDRARVARRREVRLATLGPCRNCGRLFPRHTLRRGLCGGEGCGAHAP